MNLVINKVKDLSSTTVKQNGVVVCEGFYEANLEFEMFFNLANILKNRKFRFITVNRSATECDTYVYSVLFKINTKAKCHKDDKFDEQFGRDLAEDRNFIKAFDKSKRIVAAIQECFRIEVNHLQNDVDDMTKKVGKMDAKFQKRNGKYVLKSNKGLDEEPKTE